MIFYDIVWHHQCWFAIIVIWHFMARVGLGGWGVLWRRPLATIKGWNCASQQTSQTPNYSESLFEGNIWQTGFYQGTGGSTKFPEVVAEESIVRNFRIYFVPAERQSLVDDWTCPFSLSIIGPKWTVAGACPKLSSDDHGSCDSQRTEGGVTKYPLIILHGKINTTKLTVMK